MASALADLDADLAELSLLCEGGQDRLGELEAQLAGACSFVQTHEVMTGAVACSRRRFGAIARQIRWLRGYSRRSPASRLLVARVTARRAALADRLRIEQALLAALLGAVDWQSPPFLHSLVPAAGRQNGQIRAHWDDYKRDRHSDAEGYERRYLEAMVDGPGDRRALLTGCGMSAFTTILSWLIWEGKLSGPVLAGAGLYHETRLLLERALPGRIRFVDEGDTTGLLEAIDAFSPSAVFLDSLSNTKWMPVPDLKRVAERLRDTDTYLIVDNTGLSVGCQPFAIADPSVRLVVFESLLKYAQLGLDRVNAGIIIARPDDAEILDGYREHLGTNIPDVAALALPRPNRGSLERRLARLQRNALFLAQRLDQLAPQATIIYPGLCSHPCARGVTDLAFSGGCLSIILGADGCSPRRESALIRAAVTEAADHGVQLLAGSSFGFDTTRIYLTAATADYGDPFVRIAAGIEHELGLELLAQAIANAITRCRCDPSLSG